MNERGSGEPEETEETEEGQESRDNVDNESANNSYDVFISHAGEDKDQSPGPSLMNCVTGNLMFGSTSLNSKSEIGYGGRSMTDWPTQTTE